MQGWARSAMHCITNAKRGQNQCPNTGRSCANALSCRALQSYVLAAFNGDNLPEQLRVQRQAYCADIMAFVDVLMDIGNR